MVNAGAKWEAEACGLNSAAIASRNTQPTRESARTVWNLPATLTPRMLNELVEKIEVFNAEKVNGVWEQRLRIHYNCVGTIEIPSALPLPTPDVSVNTRKGVVVNYAPCDVAI